MLFINPEISQLITNPPVKMNDTTRELKEAGKNHLACVRKRHRELGKMVNSDLLWRPLKKGKAVSRRRRCVRKGWQTRKLTIAEGGSRHSSGDPNVTTRQLIPGLCAQSS